MSDSNSSAHTAGIPNGAVPLRAGAITRVSTGPAGFGQLCTAGGPAVEVTGDNGVTVLRQLFKYPNAQNPTWMCVDNFPVQKGDSPDFVNTTACFPVEGNGTAPIALSGNPDQPFAIIDFQDLLACGRARGAPTVSEWGLMILTTSLLAFGVWTLSRRRAFAAGLPLP
jgi:hypothetical protein